MAMPTWAKIGIGCVVAVLVLIGLAFGALVTWASSQPREWTAERSISIAAAPEEIAPWVADLERWPEWSAWERDTAADLAREYGGAEQGAGATMRWGNTSVLDVSAGAVRLTVDEGGPAGHDAGSGAIEIVSADASGLVTRTRHGSRLHLTGNSGSAKVQVSSGGDHEFVSTGSMRFEPGDGETRVVWTETCSFGDGWIAGMLAAGMRGMVQSVHEDILESGLEGLKRRVESARASTEPK